MNPLLWIAMLLIALLLFWDWIVKRCRRAKREKMSEHEFLNSYGPLTGTATTKEILQVRRQIAKELGLPASLLAPDDELVALCDHFSLVGNGELALADLFDDLTTVR